MLLWVRGPKPMVYFVHLKIQSFLQPQTLLNKSIHKHSHKCVGSTHTAPLVGGESTMLM